MANPTLREIVKEWLKANGYDGLAGDCCGCFINDLFPCDNPNENCVAGYSRECLKCKEPMVSSEKSGRILCDECED